MPVVRPPTLPDRESFSGEDREVYDALVARLTESYGSGTARFDVNVFWRALLNSPPLATAVCNLAFTMVDSGKRDDGFSDHDREYINMVLSFDVGHYELVIHHLTADVGAGFAGAGIRPEAVEALWQGRDDDLLPTERQLVDYIRAVVSGTVTDELFGAIVDRFGIRGATEYTIAIAYLAMAMTLMRAFNAPAKRKELEDAIDRYRARVPG
jgi:hypothetical protein